MDITRYSITITIHAFDQALARGIRPDMIEKVLIKGKRKRFGKHGVKFISKGAKRTIICIGEMMGMEIKILTIEHGN